MQRKFLVGKDWRCRVSILARPGHILNRPAGGAVSESFAWRFRSSTDEYGTGEHAFFFVIYHPQFLGFAKKILRTGHLRAPLWRYCSLRLSRRSIGGGRLWTWQCLVKRLAPEGAVVGL